MKKNLSTAKFCRSGNPSRVRANASRLRLAPLQVFGRNKVGKSISQMCSIGNSNDQYEVAVKSGAMI